MTESFKERAAVAFTEPVETESLIVRPWRDGDEPALAALFNRDGHVLAAWNSHKTAAATAGAPLNALFVFRRDTGAATGFLEFSQDGNGRSFIACHFGKEADFTALARESGQAAIRRGVQRGFLTGELNARTRHYNYETRKLLREMGFRDRGGEMVDGMQLNRFTLDTKTYMLPPPAA